MKTPFELNSLLRAIDICNGQTALALKIGRPQATVSAWVNRFKCVGVEYAIDVSRATDWKVTPHELRPDIYPHPNDGLPADLRCACEEKAA